MTSLPPDSLSPTSLVRRGYEYWLKKKGDKILPSRADLEPEEMLPFLSLIVLADVRHHPLDFRYRLVGTGVVKHFHKDYTGSWMSEIEHQKPGSTIFTNCTTVVETKEPLFNANPYVGPQKDFLRIDELIAPLSSDQGKTVDMLFAVIEFLPKTKDKEFYIPPIALTPSSSS